ncbi:MAG: hypothetical protein J6T51_07430 [Kiritimatiellae bacterium]|nr:hypothetical protein [Kiritimatiellia bacterium]
MRKRRTDLKIPYGISDFRRIRSEGYYYIDWTDAVPSNRAGLTFYGVLNGRRIPLKNMEDGVYAPVKGFVLTFR